MTKKITSPAMSPAISTATPAATDWSAANWQYCAAAIAQVREAIARFIHGDPPPAPLPISPVVSTQPFPLDILCAQFQLSVFERDLLLACAGMELDAHFAELYSQAQNGQRSPTFHLLLAALPNADWSAFLPDAPLRYWRMLDIGAGPALTQSPLRIDERILHYLLAQTTTDDRFQGMLFPIAMQPQLVPSHQAIAQQVRRLWQHEQSPHEQSPIVQLYGSGDKPAIAAAVAMQTDQPLYRLPLRNLPTSPGDLNQLIRLWQREIRLNPAILLLDCDPASLSDSHRRHAVAQLLEELTAPLILTTLERDRSLSLSDRPLISLEVPPPTPAEQRYLWQATLGAVDDCESQIESQIDRLVNQFTLSPAAIQSIGMAAQTEATPTFSHLWTLCRRQTRPQMDDLAQRIEAAAGWSDLVLPEAQLQILRSVAAQVRQRIQVYQHWGFGDKGSRGLGISALFAGASGTGKTMAAEVLAQELALDLYRIDLSAIVSKYIGETEKNLRRVFDAAESGSVILLFDEADALFGKRSEVKDSHDRYANMEVSYLLQRMEAYQGLAILTTNLKEAIDTAFLRRLRFVIKFPFPDAAQRAEIWRRVFPANTPVAELDPVKLSRLNVAGGNIRNIALNAAFLAADAGEAVGMQHLLEAAKAEYAKLERTLTDAEVRGWL